MTENQGIQIVELRLQGLGYKQIASIVNISRDSVRSYCRVRKLDGYIGKAQKDVKADIEKKAACAFCGRPVTNAHTGRPKRFCNDDCRRRYWKDRRHLIKRSEKSTYIRTCPYCNDVFEAYGNKTRKYCCHDHYIKHRFYQE